MGKTTYQVLAGTENGTIVSQSVHMETLDAAEAAYRKAKGILTDGRDYFATVAMLVLRVNHENGTFEDIRATRF